MTTSSQASSTPESFTRLPWVRLPGETVWLVGEWRDRGEKKYYLSNLPPRTALRRLAATIKARWSCEMA